MPILVHYPKIVRMRVFGREASGALANLALVCEELLERRDQVNDQAFAWNLIHDLRVNPDWAEYWYQKYGRPPSPDSLLDSLTQYHNDLRERPVPTYADLETHAKNFVRSGIRGCPPENQLLVHVLDLWSPGARIIWEHGRRREMGILAEIAELGLHQPVPHPVIRAALEPHTIPTQRPIMSTFFAAFEDYFDTLNDSRREGETMTTLHPYWVVPWEPWISRVGSSADDWCESVGLGKKAAQTPVWIAIIQYTVRRARRLICPTQLEAHWYGRHFPTPPECHVQEGGRVVDGRQVVYSDAGYLPLREYIHAPIPLRLTDWLAAGFPVFPTTRIVGDVLDLKRDRSGHWDGLMREFPGAAKWMSRPNF